jgi:hypothetical protein
LSKEYGLYDEATTHPEDSAYDSLVNSPFTINADIQK